MRRSDALRRRVLGVALAISLLGSAILAASHTHERGTDYPQNCAVCHVVHQPVQVGDAVALPEPVLPGAVTLEASVPSETHTPTQFHPRLSRAPPA
ncbi:hypothetical protein ACFL5T_00275 [Gemmatimonadota bacterium]